MKTNCKKEKHLYGAYYLLKAFRLMKRVKSVFTTRAERKFQQTLMT